MPWEIRRRVDGARARARARSSPRGAWRKVFRCMFDALHRCAMQSPIKEWQVALQRARAIQPLGNESHSGGNFNLDALLDSDINRRLEHVRQTYSM
jgi:hypothetical protein